MVIIMRTLGNFLWFIMGGFICGICWALAGCLWCITLIGIPWGVQCFKFASLSFFPFKKEIVYGGGTPSLLLNILWILISGIELATLHFVIGLVMCITIVGIPFGSQHFKLARLALLPFGAKLVPTSVL